VSSLALTAGTVVTSLDPPAVQAADVLIEDGRVRAVGTAPDAAPRRDCSGCLILPGNVCAHTHLYSALARGMPYRLDPPTNFLQILQRVWWRLDRALDEESIRLSALLGGAEALLAGTTTLLDHHASPNAIEGSLDVIADALEQLGIRSVLAYEVTDREGTEGAFAGIEENRRFLKETRFLARGMVGAHASFTLSPETLAACADLARSEDAGVHIHVAEDGTDEADSRARYGTSVVERLAKAGILGERSLLAHCVHLAPPEVRTVAGSGATVVHNPRSNMNNGVGHAPVHLLGERVALGTDGIGADMFAESQAAYWRARDGVVTTVPQWTVDRLARGTRFAAEAWREPGLGRIEAGAPADLVVLEYPAPTPMDASNLAGHWVFGLSSRNVRDVLVQGEMVVADRRLTRVDQDQVAADAARSAQGLWRRMDDVGPHPFEPAGLR
jgi:putative selenium metabolism protein SsnA